MNRPAAIITAMIQRRWSGHEIRRMKQDRGRRQRRSLMMVSSRAKVIWIRITIDSNVRKTHDTMLHEVEMQWQFQIDLLFLLRFLFMVISTFVIIAVAVAVAVAVGWIFRLP